ncbi:MAG: PKD domain-containing protein, partial [Gemmatimonadaceae bacterium]
LYTGFIGGTPPPPNQNPVANFTYSCTQPSGTDWRCDFDGSSSTDPDGSVVAWLWTSASQPNRTGVTTFWGFAPGTYTVNLTVTDNNGATNTKSRQIIVGAPPPPNQNPVAAFTYVCTPRPLGDTACDFNGAASSDPDGTVVSWVWSTPGRGSRTGVTIRWGFTPGSTHAVTLTVTDNDGATNAKTVNVVVP